MDAARSCYISVIRVVGLEDGPCGTLLLREQKSLNLITGNGSCVYLRPVLHTLDWTSGADGRSSMAVSRVFVFPATDIVSTCLRSICGV